MRYGILQSASYYPGQSDAVLFANDDWKSLALASPRTIHHRYSGCGPVMNTRRPPSIQDLYPEDVAHCYGCGRSNPHGHQLKSFVEGGEVVGHFTPGPDYVSLPGFVYGGLLASLVDCHAMATAAAADLGEMTVSAGALAPRYVTGGLRVDYLKPTPLGVELEIRGRVKEQSKKKKIVELTVSAGGTVTVRAEVVAVRMPKSMEQPQAK